MTARAALPPAFRTLAVLAWLLPAWAGIAGASAGAPRGGDGPAAEALPRIHAIEIRSDSSFRGTDLESHLAFGPGDRLTEASVRRTLANLYASGLVSEARILTREEDGGTVAVVVLETPERVVDLQIEGDLGLPRRTLLRAIEQKVDQPLVEDRLLRSVYALQDLHVERGYLEAEVRLHVLPAGLKQTTVIFEVHSGPQALIGDLSFDALETDAGLPITRDELLAVLRSRRGTPFDRGRLAEDLDRLSNRLAERGYLTARVNPARESYDPGLHEMDLVVPLSLGPVISIEVVGASRKRLRKKGLLPFFAEATYDAALVTQTRDRLRAFYQEKGHYLCSVKAEEEVDDGSVDLRLEIDRGPVFTLREIRFEGNQHFSRDELLRLMSTSEHRTLSPGRLVNETLREDLANLRSFYVLQGFSQVVVGAPRIEVVEPDLRLTVPIVEGPRQRVVALELPGMEALDPGGVRGRLPLVPGGPFHPVLLDDTVNVILALYEEEGYLDATVTPRLDWSDDHTLVEVALEIREGRPTVIDRIVLRGQRQTHPEVLRRISGLEPGDPISRRRLLEAERRIYHLGVFSEVDVDTAPAADTSGRRDVVVRLEEGRRWRLAYGLSYHSDDGPGGLLRLSRTNLGGRADRLQLDLRGNERNQRFRLLYDQPALGRWNLPITYTLFQQREERESFTVDDLGARVAVTKDLLRLRLGVVYDYRLVDLSSESLDPLVVDREDREVEISSLTPNIFIDRRDDPLEPRHGWSTSVQLEYAFPLISATASFFKLFWQQTLYGDLGRWGVLAASWRFGAIEPLKPEGEPDPLVPPELVSAEVPASERFFAGGRTTHRAYERDHLGIPGETLFDLEGRRAEAGGNGLALLNFDYRFPIAGAFGGTIFVDVGNVWADWRDIDPADAKPGVGVGLRYLSPIGPLRLEIGWKLEPEPEESKTAFFFSFGNPF